MKRRIVEGIRRRGHCLSLNAPFTNCIHGKYNCESCLFACLVAGTFRMVYHKDVQIRLCRNVLFLMLARVKTHLTKKSSEIPRKE